MATTIRVDGTTPSGGAYSEITFFNDAGDVVDESQATRCAIRECDDAGNLIMETWGVAGRQEA